MKARFLFSLLPVFSVLVPLSSYADTNALRREIAHIEQATDELMRLVLEVQDRGLRRRMARELDELYEAAERIELIVEEDTVPKPIREEDLAVFLSTLDNAGFSDAKVEMVKEFGRSNWFTVAQVGKIVEKISFGDDKVDAILAIYPHIVDKENSYRLYEFVTFSDDRERLKQGLNALEGE